MALVEITGVHKSFGQQEVLRGVSLSVNAGEVVCLLGASGSGKTTLLRCINHLETIDQGEIKVADQLVGYMRGADGNLREENDRRLPPSVRALAWCSSVSISSPI